MSGKRGSNPRPPAWKASALSTELFPRINHDFRDGYFLWEQMDSNHRRWKPADLQSAPFGRSGILPISISKFVLSWASCRIRTNDPEITNHVLWPTELKRRVFYHFSPHLLSRRRKSGAKVQQKMHMTKYFTKKMHFFAKKVLFGRKFTVMGCILRP